VKSGSGDSLKDGTLFDGNEIKGKRDANALLSGG
jgi:hypothetical protein